jgi:hypothetical protein
VIVFGAYCEQESHMLMALSGATGFLIGVAFYWMTGRGHRSAWQLQHDKARKLQTDIDDLRHVVCELSLFKYGPQK